MLEKTAIANYMEMVNEVIKQIKRHCFAIEREYHHGFCCQRHVHAIDACIRNVSRVVILDLRR